MQHTKIALRTFLLALLTAGLFTTGCKDGGDDTVEENITKVEVHLTGGGINKEFKWEDADGDGGNAPTIESLDILPNVVYTAHIHVYDGANEITSEIEDEKNDHLFTFTVTGANLTVGDLNLDGNGKPFGGDSKWTAGAASTGSVNIKLYHEPTDKTNAATPGGDVDFDVTFPVKIQ